MGNCLDKSTVEDEEGKILEKHAIATAEIEELSECFLKYKGKRCSLKWYTSSIYSSNKENSHYGKNEDFKLMYCKREVSILLKLEHINVIEFVGIYQGQKDIQQFPVLVTEEVAKNLLYHLEDAETLQDSEKLRLSCGVSNGLSYLHSQQLAHLNLFTKSIRLTEDHVIKISNFEYACYWDKPSASASSSSVTTKANPGDPWKFRENDYVINFLPKDYQDDKIWSYDAVDIYSFGCVVINIFTLKQPTVEKESQVKEISIQSVKSIVMDCINKKVESMQKVNGTLNACLKEHFESEEPTPKPVKTKVEIHDQFDESCQNVDKETEQDFLKEHSESKELTQKLDEPKKEADDKIDESGQDTGKEADQDTGRNPETLKLGTKIQDVAVNTVVVQADAVQTDVVQTDVVQTVAVQTVAVQTVAVQTDTVMPEELQPFKASNSETSAKNKEEGIGCTETAIVPVSSQKFAEQKAQTVDIGVQTECKEIAVAPVMPHQDLQDRINKLEKEKSLLISRLTELEEQSFKFTNAFTTAGEGSVMKLRDTYRSLQTNGRPAANRAHKKTYKGIPYPIAEHTMLAYEEAKVLALKEFEAVSEKFHSLFQLKPSTDSNTSQEKENKAMRQSQQLLESFHAKPLNEKVYQILIEKYKALTNQAPDGIPKPIEDYYSELAKFTWDCVARTIPMIMSTEIGKFARDVHETKDGDDEDDDDSNKGKFVSYIYPVLFTSNSWPREIAMKGRVNILPSQESIV